MKKKFNLFEFFRIPKEARPEINKKNRFVLKVLFYIAVAFGLIGSIITFMEPREDKILAFIYYDSFFILGIAGLLLVYLKAPVIILQGIVLVFIVYIFTYMLGRTSIVTTEITFFTFLFAYIMIMQINPFLFVSFLIVYFILLMVLIEKGIVILPVEASLSLKGNLLLSLMVNFYLAFWKRRHVINEFNRDKKLSAEKEKTDILLHNVFPQKVIDQLKKDGKSPPENYDNVTVLFSDIVDFTKTSSTLDPKIVIDELNEIFTEFDRITEKNNCMRIKTIGDAYLAVCGLPEKNDNHAEQLVLCAREYLAFLEERNKNSKIKWNIRIGIDSGSAIAGIIGLKKYVYDVLGTTVEAAEKIEQACSPMRIAVSDKTYELIKDTMGSKEKESIDLINIDLADSAD